MTKFSFKKLFKKDKKAAYDARLVHLLHHNNINLVFDVGANAGQYASSLFKAGYQGKVISFEPIGENIQTLQKMAAHNKNWDIAPRMALGDTQTETEINVSADNDMSSILDLEDAMQTALPKSTYIRKETVTVNTIDSIIKDYAGTADRMFLKVDTQGFERQVIEGAKKSLEGGRISGVQLELSLLSLYQGEETYDGLCTDLHRHGFETHFIIPGFFSKTLNRQLQADFIFFPAQK